MYQKLQKMECNKIHAKFLNKINCMLYKMQFMVSKADIGLKLSCKCVSDCKIRTKACLFISKHFLTKAASNQGKHVQSIKK